MSAGPLRVIRQDVQSMHAYAIQDSAGMVKLDAMENPFVLSPALQTELGARLGASGKQQHQQQSGDAHDDSPCSRRAADGTRRR